MKNSTILWIIAGAVVVCFMSKKAADGVNDKALDWIFK